MSLVASNFGSWSTPHRASRHHPPMLLKARCRHGDGNGLSSWEETHLSGDITIRGESHDGWGKGHSPSGPRPVAATATAANSRKAAAVRNNVVRSLLDDRYGGGKQGAKRNRSSKAGGRVDIAHQRLQQEGKRVSCKTLTVGPLQVSSVAVRPFAHGELYRRPPQRISGWKPLMAPAEALSASLAPLEPQGFAPRLLDKEALCVGNGVSRGASLTSQATALRQKQLQFRHRLHQSTHKSAGLVRLIAVMREDGSHAADTAGGDRDSASRGGRTH